MGGGAQEPLFGLSLPQMEGLAVILSLGWLAMDWKHMADSGLALVATCCSLRWQAQLELLRGRKERELPGSQLWSGGLPESSPPDFQGTSVALLQEKRGESRWGRMTAQGESRVQS